MAPADTIALAVKHGATFEQHGAQWRAIARRRGRAQPLVVFDDPRQEVAAAMFLRYFNHAAKDHA